jgi:hypothetical protein
VYEALPVKYGAYYLFYVPVFRHWQYGAIDPSDPNKVGRASTGPPFWTAGDGLVEPRLMFAEDGLNISYTSAPNGRDAYMGLGINTCPTAMAGDFSQWGRGWCNPNDRDELMGTAPSTSLIWPANGMVLSPDEQSVLSYASVAPFTHNSWLAGRKLAGRHTQMEAARQRLDGFVSLDADFQFNNDTAKMPSFTTVPVRVPSLDDCGGGGQQEIQLRLNVHTNVVGFVAVELLSEPLSSSMRSSSSGSSANATGFFTRAEADIIVGNFLARPATWRGGNASINALAGQWVQLRVEFAAAKVYSFYFECANSSSISPSAAASLAAPNDQLV